MTDLTPVEDPLNAYLSFLTQVDVWKPRASKVPVNVYEILRDGYRESRVDFTLLYFLDPAERHGLGTMVIDALLQLLDGATEHTVEGAHRLFDASGALGSSDWEIETQVDYIDVLAVNSELGLAIVLENKINAPLSNPLERYVKRALKRQGVEAVLVAVLAPEVRRVDDPYDLSFASLTYDDLFDSIRRAPGLLEAALAPADLNQSRSIDLLQQFLEARTGKGAMEDLQNQMQRIETMRAREAQYSEGRILYEQDLMETYRVLKDRLDKVQPLITTLLATQEGLIVCEGGEPLQGKSFVQGVRQNGRSEGMVWFLCSFWPADVGGGARIEIKFSMQPGDEAIYLQHYWGKWRKSTKVSRVTLNLDWSASDEEIAERYVKKLLEIKDQYDSGELPTS